MLTTYNPSKNNRQLFNDGRIQIVSVKGGTITGNLTEPIPFGNKVIGFNRFYSAKGDNITISKVIVVPFGVAADLSSTVELYDFRTGSKKFFRVIQSQELFDSAPPAIQLSLADLKTEFTDGR